MERHTGIPSVDKSAGIPDSVKAVVGSGRGGPLDSSIREFMEARFGKYDFSHVRIHKDGEATELAHRLNARAFTVGKHVVFGNGYYTPEIKEGRKLLAHELTHVVQQGRSNSIKRIQRVVLGDIKVMSITEEWAQWLSDLEIEEQIDIAQDHLVTLDPTSPEYDVVRLNLRILEAETARRLKSVGNLAVPPNPTATVMLVGSPTDPATGYDKHAYNFSDAAVKLVPKIQAVIPGTQITILYFSPGYKLRGDEVHKKALRDLKATGATVIEVTIVDDSLVF